MIVEVIDLSICYVAIGAVSRDTRPRALEYPRYQVQARSTPEPRSSRKGSTSKASSVEGGPCATANSLGSWNFRILVQQVEKFRMGTGRRGLELEPRGVA